MEYCIRSTLGIIIGILNVLICIVFSINSIDALKNLASEGFYEKPNDHAVEKILCSFSLVFFLIMTIISGLLIMGITTKRHRLMLPWLIISFLGYAANAINFLVSLVIFATDTSIGSFGRVFFIGLLKIGIQTLILWLIYSLYTDIRDNQANGHSCSTPRVGYAGDQQQSTKNINYVQLG